MTGEFSGLQTVPLALSLGTFLVIAYALCLALGLIVPDGTLHRPWLQFLPGFTWTWQGMLLGFVASFGYGFFTGVIFAPIYNFFNDNR